MNNMTISKFKYIALIFSAIGFSVSCTKDEVEWPTDFDVKTEKNVFIVDEPVEFLLSGNPNFVIFYSGENGKKYENANRTKADGQQIINFETSAQNGNQVNSLALMISSDFSGTYNAQGVKSATWTDITSRATLSMGTANVKSGDVDISDFASEDQVYIAFKFTGEASSTSPQRQWTIRNFTLHNNLTDGTVYPIFANISAPNWLAVNVLNPAVGWATPSATQLSINGGPVNTPDNEDWIISSAVGLRNITPDRATLVRDMTTRSNSFSYQFSTPGKYTVTFVGINHTVYGERSQVREINLEIQ
ncbi:DUF5017 domain-containing protein [Parapedobacter deserti]|uniref:DUF5017 domain-containing protein n=1 Tax=Parapedobacter deserti TaxID=1912957 RepID=A0ABV7JHY2_9SPHI